MKVVDINGILVMSEIVSAQLGDMGPGARLKSGVCLTVNPPVDELAYC